MCIEVVFHYTSVDTEGIGLVYGGAREICMWVVVSLVIAIICKQTSRGGKKEHFGDFFVN